MSIACETGSRTLAKNLFPLRFRQLPIWNQLVYVEMDDQVIVDIDIQVLFQQPLADNEDCFFQEL